MVDGDLTVNLPTMPWVLMKSPVAVVSTMPRLSMLSPVAVVLSCREVREKENIPAEKNMYCTLKPLCNRANSMSNCKQK